MTSWRCLVAFVVVVGIVLSPVRAVAATIPTLIAYDAAVRPTTTTRVEAGPSRRPNLRGVPEYVYDAAHVGYDGAASPQVTNGAGTLHAYDNALNFAERREVVEGAVYDAPATTTAAEGAEALSTRALTAVDLGLSGKGITNLAGDVVNAGTTRIISVGNIAATRGALLGELRGALPNILGAARAEGVQTLQISGSFAYSGLADFAASQAAQYGGTFSSAAGQETLTFILGAP